MVNEREVVPLPEEWAAVKRDARTVGESGADAVLPARVRNELLDALRAGVPNEACGILVSDRYWADGGGGAHGGSRCATPQHRRIAI